MKFSEMPYSRPDLEAMKANLTACTEAFLAAESAHKLDLAAASLLSLTAQDVPTLAAAGDKILHGFYKTDTLDLTLTCYDGIGQECVKYENE